MTVKTNELKGNISFEYAEKEYTLKADHNALMGVDAVLNCGLIGVINKLSGEGLKIGEIVKIIKVGLEANGDTRLNEKQLSEAIFKMGVPKGHKIASEFCTMLFVGINAEEDEDVGK